MSKKPLSEKEERIRNFERATEAEKSEMLFKSFQEHGTFKGVDKEYPNAGGYRRIRANLWKNYSEDIMSDERFKHLNPPPRYVQKERSFTAPTSKGSYILNKDTARNKPRKLNTKQKMHELVTERLAIRNREIKKQTLGDLTHVNKKTGLQHPYVTNFKKGTSKKEIGRSTSDKDIDIEIDYIIEELLDNDEAKSEFLKIKGDKGATKAKNLQDKVKEFEIGNKEIFPKGNTPAEIQEIYGANPTDNTFEARRTAARELATTKGVPAAIGLLRHATSDQILTYLSPESLTDINRQFLQSAGSTVSKIGTNDINKNQYDSIIEEILKSSQWETQEDMSTVAPALRRWLPMDRMNDLVKDFNTLSEEDKRKFDIGSTVTRDNIQWLSKLSEKSNFAGDIYDLQAVKSGVKTPKNSLFSNLKSNDKNSLKVMGIDNFQKFLPDFLSNVPESDHPFSNVKNLMGERQELLEKYHYDKVRGSKETDNILLNSIKSKNDEIKDSVNTAIKEDHADIAKFREDVGFGKGSKSYANAFVSAGIRPGFIDDENMQKMGIGAKKSYGVDKYYKNVSGLEHPLPDKFVQDMNRLNIPDTAWDQTLDNWMKSQNPTNPTKEMYGFKNLFNQFTGEGTGLNFSEWMHSKGIKSYSDINSHIGDTSFLPKNVSAQSIASLQSDPEGIDKINDAYNTQNILDSFSKLEKIPSDLNVNKSNNTGYTSPKSLVNAIYSMKEGETKNKKINAVVDWVKQNRPDLIDSEMSVGSPSPPRDKPKRMEKENKAEIDKANLYKKLQSENDLNNQIEQEAFRFSDSMKSQYFGETGLVPEEYKPPQWFDDPEQWQRSQTALSQKEKGELAFIDRSRKAMDSERQNRTKIADMLNQSKIPSATSIASLYDTSGLFKQGFTGGSVALGTTSKLTKEERSNIGKLLSDKVNAINSRSWESYIDKANPEEAKKLQNQVFNAATGGKDLQSFLDDDILEFGEGGQLQASSKLSDEGDTKQKAQSIAEAYNSALQDPRKVISSKASIEQQFKHTGNAMVQFTPDIDPNTINQMIHEDPELAKKFSSGDLKTETFDTNEALQSNIESMHETFAELNIASKSAENFTNMMGKMRNVTLSANMSMLGLMFSAMSLIGILTRGIQTLLQPYQDLSKTFQSMGMAMAFGGKNAAKFVDGIDPGRLVKGWMDLQGIMATLQMIMANIAMKLIDSEFFDTLSNALTTFGDELLKPENIKNFTDILQMLINGLPDLIKSLQISMAIVGYINDALKDMGFNLIGIIAGMGLFGMIFLPIFAILNTLTQVVSTVAMIVAGIYQWAAVQRVANAEINRSVMLLNMASTSVKTLIILSGGFLILSFALVALMSEFSDSMGTLGTATYPGFTSSSTESSGISSGLSAIGELLTFITELINIIIEFFGMIQITTSIILTWIYYYIKTWSAKAIADKFRDISMLSIQSSQLYAILASNYQAMLIFAAILFIQKILEYILGNTDKMVSSPSQQPIIYDKQTNRPIASSDKSDLELTENESIVRRGNLYAIVSNDNLTMLDKMAQGKLINNNMFNTEKVNDAIIEPNSKDIILATQNASNAGKINDLFADDKSSKETASNTYKTVNILGSILSALSNPINAFSGSQVSIGGGVSLGIPEDEEKSMPINDSFTDLGEGLKTAITTFTSDVTKAGKTWATSVGTAASEFVTGVSGHTETLKTELGAAKDGLISGVQEKWTGFTTELGEKTSTFATTLETAWNQFVNGDITWLEFATTISTAVSGFVLEIGKEVVKFGIGLGEEIGNFLLEIAKAGIKFAKEFGDEVVKFIDKFVEATGTFITEIGTAFVNLVSDIVSEGVKFATGLGSAFSQIVSKILEWASSIFGGGSSSSSTNVNDAIITKSGQVIKTDPRDYIMATMNPQELVQGVPVGTQFDDSNIVDALNSVLSVLKSIDKKESPKLQSDNSSGFGNVLSAVRL